MYLVIYTCMRGTTTNENDVTTTKKKKSIYVHLLLDNGKNKLLLVLNVKPETNTNFFLYRLLNETTTLTATEKRKAFTDGQIIFISLTENFDSKIFVI